MRFCVLGHRGMLGHTVSRFLTSCGHAVATVDIRFSAKTAGQFTDAIIATNAEWCINAIGIKSSSDPNSLMEINAELPRACIDLLPSRIGFIHASSDGVFRPDRSERSVDEQPDATDAYGISKMIGESCVVGPKRAVLRCSFIGPDLGAPKNLMSWLLNSSQPEINGYANHSWNGITSLQWARLALELAESNLRAARTIVQPATTPPTTKCDLLAMICNVWDLPIRINPTRSESEIRRTLVPSINGPSLEDQIRKLQEWMRDSPPSSSRREIG